MAKNSVTTGAGTVRKRARTTMVIHAAAHIVVLGALGVQIALRNPATLIGAGFLYLLCVGFAFRHLFGRLEKTVEYEESIRTAIFEAMPVLRGLRVEGADYDLEVFVTRRVLGIGSTWVDVIRKCLAHKAALPDNLLIHLAHEARHIVVRGPELVRRLRPLASLNGCLFSFVISILAVNTVRELVGEDPNHWAS